MITPQLKLVIKKGANNYRENLFTAYKIVLLLFEKKKDSPYKRNLILFKRLARQTVNKESYLQTISYNHALYMPLHYFYFILYIYDKLGRNLFNRLNNISENRIRVNLFA
jgi:hypothetical protein